MNVLDGVLNRHEPGMLIKFLRKWLEILDTVDKAVELAKGINGVREVKNEMSIKPS